MIMTEEKAKEKWCRFSRTAIQAGNGAVAVNRDISDDEPANGPAERVIFDETRCLGSGCMAWRWGPVEYEWVEIPTAVRSRSPLHYKPDGSGWELVDLQSREGKAWRREKPRLGYCGEAGKP